MPDYIGDIHLYSMEYAKEHLSRIELPYHPNGSGYGCHDKDVLDALLAAVPHCNGVEINDLHCTRTDGGYNAAFTWHYPQTQYSCTTQYVGDGIYCLTGVTHYDNTVVRLMYDTHCMSAKRLGDDICTELLCVLEKEEEYEHIDGERGRRLPERLTKKQLLAERTELIEKRKKCIKMLENASGMGINFWKNAIARREEDLRENADLLGQV